MTVQPGLCRTCSETTLFVFPRGGSYVDLHQIDPGYQHLIHIYPDQNILAHQMALKYYYYYTITDFNEVDMWRLLYDKFHIVPHINPRFPYQPDTFVSALGWCENRGLIQDLRVDTWCDM